MSSGPSYLVASVACSVAVAAMLKLARRWQVDVRQAIMVNHAVAALLCWIVLRPDPAALLTPRTPWLVLAALGVLLPSGFMAMALAVRHAGVVRSDAAQRLSLFIPLLAAFLLFGEPVSGRKLGAIALAFAALFCLLRRPPPARAADTADSADTGQRRALWLWPLAVWVAYGLVDILFKQVARAGTAFAGGLLLAFALASMLMLAYLLWRRARWAPRHLAAGVALGVVNFGNIITYIRAHQALPDHPALVFAAMNMGVITLGTLVGALVFREPLGRVNGLGLALALAAILLMAPW
ncbi:EamA/RhaT family transporter [Achromobacter pulmonis]|nr:EamA/RhaT family transporter [Achromobacter pulmonis]MCF7768725.1 EamA/RhaT family transporter [Achromobacter pulmonis]